MNIKRVIAATAATAIVLMLGATPALADFTTVHVYAYGVLVDYTDQTGHVGLGPLPVVGPFDTDTDFTYDTRNSIDGPKLTTTYTQVWVEAHSTDTSGGWLQSEFQASDVNVLADSVTASVVIASCAIHRNSSDYIPAATAYSTDLVIGGVAFGNGVQPPDTVLPVATTELVGTVTLNERTYDSLTNTLIVNAIHIRATGGTGGTGDIIIGHVECGGLAEPPVDIPESPFAILIPLVGLAAIAGAWYLRRNPITGASH